MIDDDIANFTTTIDPVPVPSKRKRRVFKRKRSHPAVLKYADNEYIGVNAVDCPIGCNPKRCVITHNGHCGHPFKGELHSHESMNPAIVKRRNAVRKILALQAASARHRDDE